MTASSSMAPERIRKLLAPVARRLLSPELRSRIYRVRDRLVMARFASDLATFITYWRLLSPKEVAGGDPVRLRFRRLQGQPISVRPGTSDPLVVMEMLLGKFHLPPRDVTDIEEIWDLGSNIGLTIADLLSRYPRARVCGVELDGGTAAICRSNIQHWGSRAELIHGAVWTSDGSVDYELKHGLEFAARVLESADDSSPSPERCVAISLDSLLEQRGREKMVDYVKMDIEGAEARILTVNTGWAQNVRSIKVETHAPYTTDECQADLRRLGFRTELDSRHHACVVGYRVTKAP